MYRDSKKKKYSTTLNELTVYIGRNTSVRILNIRQSVESQWSKSALTAQRKGSDCVCSDEGSIIAFLVILVIAIFGEKVSQNGIHKTSSPRLIGSL